MCVVLKPKINYTEIAELEEEQLSFPRQTSDCTYPSVIP